jgi:hypothetical protein
MSRALSINNSIIGRIANIPKISFKRNATTKGGLNIDQCDVLYSLKGESKEAVYNFDSANSEFNIHKFKADIALRMNCSASDIVFLSKSANRKIK